MCLRIFLIGVAGIWMGGTLKAQKFQLSRNDTLIVDVSEQRLYVKHNGEVVRVYPVSTSKYGVGNRINSYKTPLGLHRVWCKIGDGAPLGAIFKGGQYTGAIATIYTDSTDVPQDDVTTRILWLEGLEPGKNQGGLVDTKRRHIYIHGTPEEGLIGTSASHGCIRMRNQDVIELFEMVPEGIIVWIQE